MRAGPCIIGRTSRRWHGLTPLPAACKRGHLFFYCQLICVFELILDILRYLFSILARGVNAVRPTPKPPVSLFALQICRLCEDDHAAFPLEEPCGAGNARLERPLCGHMYWVKTAFCFDVLLLILLPSWQTALLLYQKEFPFLAPRESLSNSRTGGFLITGKRGPSVWTVPALFSDYSPAL